MISKVMIAGCGGVGGVASARLWQAGLNVTAVTNNESITRQIVDDGLRAQLGDEFVRAEIDAVNTPSEADGTFDLLLVATPPDGAQAAVEAALPHLKTDARIVTFPNGLIEERLQAIVDEDRLLGGIVSYGASMVEPGRIRQTAVGGVTLGRLDGQTDDQILEIQKLLAPIGEIHLSENLRGARWSKLAINCAISSIGTVGNDRLGALMRHRFVRRLALETMTEVVAVAKAEGVQLEKVSGTLDLDWLALSDDERLRAGSTSLLAKHTVLLAVGTKYRNMRSSMLRAIERGRKPPVDFLNGEIVDRATKHGIQAPINQALKDAVWSVSDQELHNSITSLKAMFEESRDTLRELDMVA